MSGHFHDCEGIVPAFRTGAEARQCFFYGKIEVGGKWYCKMHVPIPYGKSRAEFFADTRSDAKELARRADCFPELLAAQTMGQTLNTPDFIDWMADRLVMVHGDSENMDFIHSARDRAKAGRAAITKAENKETR